MHLINNKQYDLYLSLFILQVMFYDKYAGINS